MTDIDQIIDTLDNLKLTPENIENTQEEENMATFRDHIDTIPTFNGDQKTVGIFITAAQATIDRLKKPSDEVFNATLFQAIRNKLVGQAQAIVATNPHITWEQIKEEIRRRFGDQRTENTLTTELLTLTQQRNEKPLEFGERCKDLRDLILSKIAVIETPAILMYKTTMFNDIALQTFLKGTNPELSRILRCKSPKTLEEALRMTTEEENYLYVRNHFTTSNNVQRNIPRPIPRPPQVIRNQPIFTQPMTYSNFNAVPRQPNYFPNYFQSNQTPNQFSNNFQPNQFQRPPWNHRFPNQSLFNNNQNFQSPFNNRNTNVFKPNPNKILPKPTPMDVSSNNTRRMNTSLNARRPFQPKPAPTPEELYYQENQSYPEEYYENETTENYAPYYENGNYNGYYEDMYENFEKELQETTVQEVQTDRYENVQNFQEATASQAPT